MARPKKLSDTDAVRLVDEFYETCGNPGQLKYSSLEKFAAARGIDVNAYDLRRSAAVRERISQLKNLSVNSEFHGAAAYKALDIDNFIRSSRSIEDLKRNLAELDGRWRKLYDYAADVSKQHADLEKELRKATASTADSNDKNRELSNQAGVLNRAIHAVRAENRYLRKMIQQYLYPALADTILQELGELNTAEMTAAARSAVDAMTDADIPSTFSESILGDTELRSREDILFDKLRLQSRED